MSDTLSIGEIAVGVAAIAITIGLFLKDRSRRSLGFATVTVRPLLSASMPFTVDLRYDDDSLSAPTLFVFRIGNTGNTPLKASDFESEIRICLGNSTVVTHDVTGASPSDLAPTASSEGGTITIEPCLLNPRDVFEVQCLLEGVPEYAKVESRIAGVREVKHVKLPRDSWGKLWRLSMLDRIVFTSQFVLLIGLVILSVNSGWPALTIFAIVAAIAWAWYSIGVIRRNRVWLSLPPSPGH